MKPKAVRFIRSDGLIEICGWCPDSREVTAWLCDNHDDAHTVQGVCPDCIAHFKADSLKGSTLALQH